MDIFNLSLSCFYCTLHTHMHHSDLATVQSWTSSNQNLSPTTAREGSRHTAADPSETYPDDEMCMLSQDSYEMLCKSMLKGLRWMRVV